MQEVQKHFAIYTSTAGNYFFEEIRDLIAAGLRQLGIRVTLQNENQPYLSDADWHVFVAPHEFFYLGRGEILRKEGLPENSVIVNTEQPSTQWFALAHTMFQHAKAIWDIDYHSSQNIMARKIECSYLPLGYVPDFKSYRRMDKLPAAIAPDALTMAERKHSFLDDPWIRRPIDVLFMGTMTSQREQFFKRFGPVAAKYNSYLHKTPAGGPIVPGNPWYIGTEGSVGLAQRSKILLNIHRGNDVYFEWHRVVMLGIWQRALVISDPCTSAPPFKSGIDYVEAPPGEIPSLVEYYLSSADGRNEAQEIVQHGFRTLTENCRLADSLSLLIDRLPATQTRKEKAFLPAKIQPEPRERSREAVPRICVVLGRNETRGRDYGGPAGMLRMANLLAEAGNEVTVLHASPDWRGTGAEQKSDAAGASSGIAHLTLPAAPFVQYEFAGRHVIDSMNAYLWLRENRFDTIHFADSEGIGFYSLLAKHQGLAFMTTNIAVHINGPSRRIIGLNSAYLAQPRDLEVDFMEQQCISLADAVASQFQNPIEWIEAEGWRRNENEFVKPYPVGHASDSASDRQIPKGTNGLILLTTKVTPDGIKYLSRSAERLREIWRGRFATAILSLEKPDRSQEIRMLLHSSSEKPGAQISLEIADTLSRIEEILTSNRCVVMLLPTDENLPELALMLKRLGVPFLTASPEGAKGLSENVPLENGYTLASPARVASKLKSMFDRGTEREEFEANDNEVENAWVNWSVGLGKNTGEKSAEAADDELPVSTQPLVSVCIVHHNRRSYLEQALASIESQDYRNFEVVLVDDGSDVTEAIQYLEEIEPKFKRRGWKIVRQENKYLGAARNTAARHAKGDFILFMDDDNIAKPEEISTFVKAAAESKSDILTCITDVFSGDHPPETGQRNKRWLHLGPALSVGVFKNCFGDANAFIRRKTFEAVGGFTEEYGITHEDWEFFAKAALAGARLEVLPEALFWYRASVGSMVHSTNTYANTMRSLRPYLQAVPQSLRPLLHLGLGLNMHRVSSGALLHQDEVVELVSASRTLFDLQQYEHGVMVMYAALNLALKTDKTSLAEEITAVLRKPNFKAILAKNGISLDKLLESFSFDLKPGSSATLTFRAGESGPVSVPSGVSKPASSGDGKLTSIVILTYNQLEYTKLTLDSIRRHTKAPYEIIVVDNASSDGTVEYLKTQKDILLIANESNAGFPAGCNQGIERSKGHYVLLLNNDVVVTDEWLNGLIECAESSPLVGIVGPMSNRVSGLQLERNVGYTRLSRLQDYAKKYRTKNRRKWFESPRVAGLCMLIKREVIHKIGGLDPAFGLGNCEDDDYCLRAAHAGFKVAIASDVFIHHFGSKSFAKDGWEKYKDFIRTNELIFKDKWGIAPLEWWREGKPVSKDPPLHVRLSLDSSEGSISGNSSVLELRAGAQDILGANGAVAGLKENGDLRGDELDLTSERIDALYADARSLAINGNTEESIRMFEDLLKIRPDHSGALNDLGALYFQKGLKGKAAQHFRDSINANPMNIEAMRNLGDLYLEAGQVEEAMKTFKDVLAVKPNDRETMQKIGYVCSILGRTEDAMLFYSKAEQNA